MRAILPASVLTFWEPMVVQTEISNCNGTTAVESFNLSVKLSGVWLFWNNGSEAGYDVIPQCASRASVVEMEHYTHLFPQRSFGDASLCCRLCLDQGRRLCPRARAFRAPHRAIALAGGTPDDPQ